MESNEFLDKKLGKGVNQGITEFWTKKLGKGVNQGITESDGSSDYAMSRSLAFYSFTFFSEYLLCWTCSPQPL